MSEMAGISTIVICALPCVLVICFSLAACLAGVAFVGIAEAKAKAVAGFHSV